MWRVRSYQSGDRDAVMTLASRLLEGAAPWRDGGRWLTAVHGWAVHSIEVSTDDDHALLVAVRAGRVVGFVSVSARDHFTGDIDAYIGELVVSPAVEGHGAGLGLLAAAEGWASRQGHERVTLETGAANTRARAFYAGAGYVEEEVRLTKLLATTGEGQSRVVKPWPAGPAVTPGGPVGEQEEGRAGS